MALVTNIVLPSTLFTETTTEGKLAELRNLHDQLGNALRTIEEMLDCFESIEDSEHAKARLAEVQEKLLENQRVKLR
tara:strand:+ start:875 stop:1105 length:231 start_codon:yes stop_codon:yes gene_type:complete